MENFESKNEWEDVARELYQLQEKENDGLGVPCVRQVVDELRRGDIEGARTIADMDGDKLRGFPSIENFLEEKLFADIQDSRLKLRKKLLEGR